MADISLKLVSNGLFVYSYIDDRVYQEDVSYTDILNNPSIPAEYLIDGILNPASNVEGLQYTVSYTFNYKLNRVLCNVNWKYYINNSNIKPIGRMGGFRIKQTLEERYLLSSLKIENFGSIPVKDTYMNPSFIPLEDFADGDFIGLFQRIPHLEIDTNAGSPQFGNISLANCFSDCSDFNSNIQSWNLSSVTNVSGFFRNCIIYNQPVNTFNLANVIDMSWMFCGAFEFNQPVNNWNVSKCEFMTGMFQSAMSFNQNLSSWKIVLEQNDIQMIFDNAISFNNGDILGGKTKPLGQGWMILKCNTRSKYFNRNCPLTRENSYPVIPNGLSGTLIYMYSLNYTPPEKYRILEITDDIIPIRRDNIFWCEDPVIEKVNEEFNMVKVSIKWTIMEKNVSLVNRQLYNGWNYAGLYFNHPVRVLTDAPEDINPRDVEEGTYNIIYEPYYRDCNLKIIKFDNIPLAQFSPNPSLYIDDISSNIMNGGAFSDLGTIIIDKNSGSPTILPLSNLNFCFTGTTVIGSLSSWNVSNAVQMEGTFYSANYNEGLSGWNVSQVVNMSHMFSISNFNQDINNWNVSNVTNMDQMFRDNMYFNKPLNNWNVSKIETLNSMFQNASSFNQNLSNWKLWGLDKNKNPNIDISNVMQIFSGALSFNNGADITNKTSKLGLGWYYVKNLMTISGYENPMEYMYSSDPTNIIEYCPLTLENSWPLQLSSLTKNTIGLINGSSLISIPLSRKMFDLYSLLSLTVPKDIQPLKFSLYGGTSCSVTPFGVVILNKAGTSYITITQDANDVFTSGSTTITVTVTKAKDIKLKKIVKNKIVKKKN